MPLVCSSAVLLNRSLLNVPFVARIPIVFVFEFRAAGFMAGSIPIKGVLGYFFLKVFIALVVAVLQATTIILQFLFK